MQETCILCDGRIVSIYVYVYICIYVCPGGSGRVAGGTRERPGASREVDFGPILVLK